MIHMTANLQAPPLHALETENPRCVLCAPSLASLPSSASSSPSCSAFSPEPERCMAGDDRCRPAGLLLSLTEALCASTAAL